MRISSRQAGWIGFLGGFLVRLLGWTWRLREGGHQWSVSEAKLYVFLHGHILLAAFLHRDRDGVTMISEHRDG
ncbi:MAG: hypothetical protein ACYST0_05510, partial [Planctomycetota bacterium]